jgi:hypothetical protein
MNKNQSNESFFVNNFAKSIFTGKYKVPDCRCTTKLRRMSCTMQLTQITERLLYISDQVVGVFQTYIETHELSVFLPLRAHPAHPIRHT